MGQSGTRRDGGIDVKSKQIKGEKKAIKLLETFEYKPEKYAERVNHIFEVLGLSLIECYDMTEKLYKEVKKLQRR